MSKDSKIAIIGLGSLYADAANTKEFWENIKAAKNCIREIDKNKWNPEDYYSSDFFAEHKSYSTVGGFIQQSHFPALNSEYHQRSLNK